jgi:hypothetical protein
MGKKRNKMRSLERGNELKQELEGRKHKQIKGEERTHI